MLPCTALAAVLNAIGCYVMAARRSSCQHPHVVTSVVLQRAASVCTACKRTTPLRTVATCFAYEGLAKELLHTAKYERAEAGLREIAQLMAPSLAVFDDVDAIVPVPTASSRERERGYDHARLVATYLGRQSTIRPERLLTRLGQAHQVGATRLSRIKQMKDAFRIVGPLDKVRGKHIVLVDDVCTTGATLEEAARVLKRAGATRVDALLFARA